MSVNLLVCQFLSEIRQIWGYLHFWMICLTDFLGHSWDIGSLVFTLLGWANILTFEFLCAGLDFETSDLATFWLSGGQLLRPSGLVFNIKAFGKQKWWGILLYPHPLLCSQFHIFQLAVCRAQIKLSKVGLLRNFTKPSQQLRSIVATGKFLKTG